MCFNRGCNRQLLFFDFQPSVEPHFNTDLYLNLKTYNSKCFDTEFVNIKNLKLSLSLTTKAQFQGKSFWGSSITLNFPSLVGSSKITSISLLSFEVKRFFSHFHHDFIFIFFLFFFVQQKPYSLQLCSYFHHQISS